MEAVVTYEKSQEKQGRINGKAIHAIKSLIAWAAERGDKEVAVNFELVSNDVQKAIEADGYEVLFHRDVNGVSFLIRWQEAYNVGLRDQMMDALKNSDNVKIRFAVDRYFAGLAYEFVNHFFEAVYQGDIKRAARLASVSDFKLLMKVNASLL